MYEYIFVEKSVSEFQKLLNQWKHLYYFDIVYIKYDINSKLYHALIKRTKKESIKEV